MSKRARQREKDQQKKVRKRPTSADHDTPLDIVSEHEQPSEESGTEEGRSPTNEPIDEPADRPAEPANQSTVGQNSSQESDPDEIRDESAQPGGNRLVLPNATEPGRPRSHERPRKPDRNWSESSSHIAREIAKVLGETEKHPQLQIKRIIKLLGDNFAYEMLEKARQIEAQGGLMLPDGSRRRTFGGVYFYLVKEQLSTEDRRDELKTIFPQYGSGKARKERQSDPNQPPPPPPLPTATWRDRGELIAEARQDPGKAHSVKVTIIGKLGKTVERQNFTLAIMNHNDPPKNLPKGIPLPEKVETTSYVVYIGGKQWRKLKEALKNPEDVAIIEGQQIFDKSYDAICVFATNCTTKLTEQAKRDAQRAKATDEE